MKKRWLATMTALLVCALAVGCKGKNHDDFICDNCGVNGKEVTVSTVEGAMASKDDEAVNALIQKIVVKYEKDVELCELCADEKYGDPNTMDSGAAEVWQKEMKDIIPFAQQSLSERYGEVMELLYGTI